MNEIQERRKTFDKLGQNYPKATSVNVVPALINGVSCYWFNPNKTAANNVIIYLHGGAFVVGSIQSHRSMVSHFAEKLQTRILFVEYSLAPELPYPHALNDVLAVYRDVIANYPGHHISFIGDSAGAGLTLSVMGEMAKQQIEFPQAVVMISPWISLANNNASIEDNRQRDVVLSKEYMDKNTALYTGSTPLEISSPEFVEFDQFPPVLIMVGTNEILFDDSQNFYDSIKNKQTNATLSVYENQYHVWPLANINSDPSQQALTEMEAFFTSVTQKALTIN